MRNKEADFYNANDYNDVNKDNNDASKAVNDTASTNNEKLKIADEAEDQCQEVTNQQKREEQGYG